MVQAMGLEGAHAEGATPLDPDEVAGLIPKHINTQSALNEWEQQNILEATQWLMRVISRKTLLTEDFVRVWTSPNNVDIFQCPNCCCSN